MSGFKGKTIWVIGASTGIGRAVAEELDAQGARLILSARGEDKLQTLNSELDDKHQVAALDVCDFDALRHVAETADRIDGVVFMAAIYTPPSQKKVDLSMVQKVIQVNIGGAFNCIEAIKPLFLKQGFGQIALCGSVAGYRGLPYGQPYSATKAAMISYAESLKVELAENNIDVKLISPGFVRTPMTQQNDFDMPMVIEADEAATQIAKGLGSSAFEIHFPKKFTFIMKLLRILPSRLFFIAANKMRRKN